MLAVVSARLRSQLRQRAVIALNSPDEKILEHAFLYVSLAHRGQLAPIPVPACFTLHQNAP